MEKKLKHLEMLQSIMERMARNSFSLKEWSVVVVSAVAALAAAGYGSRVVGVAFIPWVMFWILDGYFVGQERLFRKLYDRVRVASEADVGFSMDTSGVKGEGTPWIGGMFSKMVLIYHGAILASVVGVAVITVLSGRP